jgi:hypothetical protein
MDPKIPQFLESARVRQILPQAKKKGELVSAPCEVNVLPDGILSRTSDSLPTAERVRL